MQLIYDEISELKIDYLEYLREQKSQGKKLIGYFAHEFVPDELIHSHNAIPVPLIWAGDEDKTIIGSEYLTPSICPFALSQLGAFEKQKNNGSTNFYGLIDGLIATNYCAADFIVNECISNEFNLRLFKYHIPFLQSRAHVNYFTSEIKKFSSELAEFTGFSFSLEKYQDSYHKYKEIFNLLEKINDMSILGSIKNKINQVVRLIGPNIDMKSKLNQFIESIPDNKNINNQFDGSELLSANKVLFIGAPVFIGDKTHEFIEECGGLVLRDITWLGSKFYMNFDNGSFPKSQNDVYMMIARRIQNNKSSLHLTTQLNPLYNYVKYVKDMAKKYNTKAIINHIIKFCDIVGHHRQDIKNELNKSGYNVLNLERDYSRSMHGQLRTRIEAFLEMNQ